MNTVAGGETDRVERLMTLSERAFAHSIGALLPPGTAVDDGQVAIPLPAGQVTIAYDVLPSLHIGRSLELPRLRVVLTFTGAGQAERRAFLTRFDIAFQRGGG